ncbi:MAG: molybdopterin-dependent oxidoreductase [Nitrospirae bacterium]|nr:molybdopterin-dependent oxidoreductase [Nitrospirota bacterium]
MSKLVKISINGAEYKVPAGMNLIDAAESVGVHIPNFCYLKGMRGIGACRMCMVEIGGRMTTGCIMKTKDGMDVVTDNEKIRELRKFVIDLILSMHPLDCMTCTKAGVCELQKYAYEFEIKESSFTRKKFGFPVDNKNPFINRDPDYCILCSRCVRVCKEQGTSVLDFQGRGVGSRVVTAEDKPLQDGGCTFCGSCIDACPVNALLEADRWRKGREWEYERYNSVCLSCGNACDTVVSVHDKDVAKVNAGADNSRAGHYICAYGRFGFDFINADTRVMSPLKRIDGELKPISWDEAYATAADLLRSPSDAGIVTTGNLLNEDILTLRNFAGATGIKDIDSTVSLYADGPSLLGDEVDLEGADLILLAGINPSQWERVFPALDATLRKMVSRGAKLVVINSGQIRLSDIAIKTLQGDEAVVLGGLAKGLTGLGLKAPDGLEIPETELSEDMTMVAEMYSVAKSPVILSSPLLYEASANISLLKGDALAVPIEANAKGTLLMGLKGNGATYTEMTSGGAKILYAIGEVPVRRPAGVDFLIVQHSHLSELAKEADLVLPAATSFETDGSVVDYMGRLKTLDRAIEPFGEARSHREILKGIAKKMNIDLKTARTADVKKEKKAVTAGARPVPFSRREDLAFNPEDLVEAMNTTMINSSRLLWLKEVEQAVAEV